MDNEQNGKDKKQLWAEAKRKRREKEKEYYRYAPGIVRVWNLYLKKPAIVLLVAALLFNFIADFDWESRRKEAEAEYYYAVKDTPLSEKDMPKIYELSPKDEEGEKRIDALPAAGADETWTFCIYMVGSDLEDNHENELSSVTRQMTEITRDENIDRNYYDNIDRLTRFNEELASNGLEMPAFFYNPEWSAGRDEETIDEPEDPLERGGATVDIEEMTADQWSDNISIVIQTGGARKWENMMMNPNRTQRFLYRGGAFTEVANLPLAPASEPDTLADFLTFCRDEYRADHNVLVLWNHGSGPFGYGADSIYKGCFSLRDIREALLAAYTPDDASPAFDIIAFDACLMSTIEVTHALAGFADYFCLSEESEPTGGWFYTPIFRAMTEDATMSPAKVAQTIADSYMDHYMAENINQDIYSNNLTFSVIDAKKTEEVYAAYSDLCKTQLLDAIGNPGVLADISSHSQKSTRFAGSHYNYFNTVDLGNYMDSLAERYPEACGRVRKLVSEAVLYHRESGGFSDATGLAVYVPSEVSDLQGLLGYLQYEYGICDDDAIRALYYYKQAGCLNDELKEYVATLTDREVPVLDIECLKRFGGCEPEMDGNRFSIPLEKGLKELVAGYAFEFARVKEEEGAIISYGREKNLTVDYKGTLSGEFDGRWICLDNEPLYVEVVSASSAATEYRAHVLYNGDEAYLEIMEDAASGALSLGGVRKVELADENVNYMINTRSNEQVTYGAKITPVYMRTDYATNSMDYDYGDTVTFSNGTRLSRRALANGYYIGMAVISDPRGDSYYSAVIATDIVNGMVKGWELDPSFVGRDY